MIALLQDDFFANRFSVDRSSVCASQVTQTHREIIDGKDAVMTTDEFSVGAQLTILFTTDEKFLAVQGNGLSCVFARDDL